MSLPSPGVFANGGMTLHPWTRVPFFEMWGKPKSCREPQELVIIISKSNRFVNRKFNFLIRSHITNLPFTNVS